MAFLKGGLVGSIVGFASDGKMAWVSGLIGTISAIAGVIANDIRLGKSPTVGEITRAAIGGWAGGVISGTVTRLIRVGEISRAADAIIGAIVGNYTAAW